MSAGTRSFELTSLGNHERDVLLVLALTGPRSISQYVALVRAAGLRETATRAHSTTSLRVAMAPLIDAGAIFWGSAGFDCAPRVRQWALRDGARRAVLGKMASALRSEAYPELRYAYGRPVAAWFDFFVALHQRDLERASQAYVQCAELDGALFIKENPLVEAVCAPFDPKWMAGFGTKQGAVAAWALDYANRFALPSTGLVPWVREHLSALERDVPALRDFLVEAAFLRGEFDIVREQLSLPVFRDSVSGTAYRATLALLDGDATAARSGFEQAESLASAHSAKKKAEPVLPRLCAVFQCLELIHRGSVDDLKRAARLALSRQRDKTYEFRQAAGLLKITAEALAAPKGVAESRHPMQTAEYHDPLAPLMRGLFALWLPVDLFERLGMVRMCVYHQKTLVDAGYGWLAREYSLLAHALKAALAEDTHGSELVSSQLPEMPAPPQHKNGDPQASLLSLFAPMPAWQLALQALEQLTAPQETPSAAPESGDERIVWRVWQNGSIEAFLQKRSSKGWTAGRKIATKQLLADGAQYGLLTVHDARVAHHVREDISTNYAGYVNRDYFISTEALVDLVGHPRVFIEPDWDEPVELTRGEVRLRANAQGHNVVIQMEPPNLTKMPRLVPEGRRWVVYCLDKRQHAISEIVGSGLTIPSEAKQQTLELLAKLASFMVIESSEQVATQQVAADMTLWLQMVPCGVGLNVTLSMRPLGEKGPHVTVGEGVATIVGHLQGNPVQAERNLVEERKRLTQFLRQCPVLQRCEVEPGAFSLSDPESCLELLSQLREVGDGVQVQWPQGKPLTLRAKLGKRALHGWLRHEAGWFLAGGTLEVDSELSLELKQLVDLLAEGSDRFIKLDSGEYLELEGELRDMVDALRHSHTKAGSRQELALPMGALASLDLLTHPQSGWELDASVTEWRARVDAAFAKPIPIPKGLQGELRDYQLEGYRWLSRLAELELGACLADDMGLGKTVQLICLLLRRASQGVALVVAPTSVCHNWQQELQRFAPTLNVRNYVGAGRDAELRHLKKRDVVVTSYTLLQQDSEALQAIEWATVILDEGQFIKNSETQRARAACSLRASVRIVATGTPIENHPGDLHSLFQFLNPELFGSAQVFQRRFGRAAESDDKVGARQRKELRRLLKPFILRRTKAQVLEDLPPITEICHAVELSSGEALLYEAVRKQALSKIERLTEGPQNRIQILAELMRLRRLCCHPALVAPESNLGSSKLATFMDLVQELLENKHRSLVFSQFVDFLTLARKLLEERGIAYQYLDGSTPPKQRTAQVEAFQAGEGDLFLISLKAGGFGLNLTGADYVIHLDPWWNPAAERQATDRAHRIGQERPVTVYRLVTAGTIEERIVELHHRKRELADTLLEGAEGAAKVTQSELLQLLGSSNDDITSLTRGTAG